MKEVESITNSLKDQITRSFAKNRATLQKTPIKVQIMSKALVIADEEGTPFHFPDKAFLESV